MFLAFGEAKRRVLKGGSKAVRTSNLRYAENSKEKKGKGEKSVWPATDRAATLTKALGAQNEGSQS